MHRRAEYGVAAHWGYKEQRSPTEDLGWLQRIVDWQQETTDPSEFMESLKIDLEQDEVFVFTPKGRVITLPAGATPVDFAYAIHTEVGHRCIGARVNGRLVPLDSPAARRATPCEIFTSQGRAARARRRDWLQFVADAAGPQRRSASGSRRERRVDAIETGRDELVKALRREGLPVQKLAAARRAAPRSPSSCNYADLDALLRRDRRGPRVGQGGRPARRSASSRGGEEQLPATVARPPPAAAAGARPTSACTSRASTT